MSCLTYARRTGSAQAMRLCQTEHLWATTRRWKEASARQRMVGRGETCGQGRECVTAALDGDVAGQRRGPGGDAGRELGQAARRHASPERDLTMEPETAIRSRPRAGVVSRGHSSMSRREALASGRAVREGAELADR